MSTGIPVPAGIAAPVILKEFDLPSGAHAIIRKGKGKDLRMALMAAGTNADQYRILYAILARLATVDDKMLTMEGIDDMDLLDAQALLTEGGRVLSPLKQTRLTVLEVAQTGASTDVTSSPRPASAASSNGESVAQK